LTYLEGVKTLLVCGGGNGAHALVPVAVENTGCRVKIFAPYGSEANLLEEKIRATGGIKLSGALASKRVVPDMVTADPREAAEGVDVVLLVLPAFAHGAVLAQLAPHLPLGVRVGAVPARSGFEYQAYRILADNGPGNFRIFGMQTLPWACRIKEFGSEVDILGVKRGVGAAAIPQGATVEITKLLKQLLNIEVFPYDNMLALSLSNMGQIIHPGIMYGLFKDYGGEVFTSSEIPLFYSGVTDEIAAVLKAMSAEIQDIKEALGRFLGPEIKLGDVPTLKEWLFESYAGQIEDAGTVASAFRTNRAYRGLKAPVKQVEGGYVPDFKSRYLTEDVPTGLLATRALAEMSGVHTPVIDMVIYETSVWMGKEYLVDGKLAGRDIAEARIPQNYGVTSLDDLKKLLLEGVLAPERKLKKTCRKRKAG